MASEGIEDLNETDEFRDHPIGSSIVAVDTMHGPRNIVLTFDDGPEATGTHEVLTALDDAGATATFFVLLSRTRINPSIVGEVLAQGHEIGLHGSDHESLHNMSFEKVLSRTLQAKSELESLIGQSVRWFRPPYGNQSISSWRGVIQAGLESVHWSVQCDDWLDPRTPDYEQYMGEIRKVQNPGAIVLAHDNYATHHIDNAIPGTIPTISRGQLARKILQDFSEKELICCSLGQALETGRPIRNLWSLRAELS